jgi:curved DNA-binding protein CbpA
MEAKIDPLKILGLPKNYNIAMLREAYKSMALKAHPDKGGSEYLFKIVTQCYKYLAAELKKKEADKQFHELKKEFMSALERDGGGSGGSGGSSGSSSRRQRESGASGSRGAGEPDMDALQSLFYKGTRFDQAKFNKFFDENKLKDEVHEQGYKDWMKDNEVAEAPKFRGSFNSQGFNNHFEQNANVNANSKHLIKYQEPEALVASKRLGFTELGQDNVDDFSGENKSMRNLNYMDYRIAHTTSRMVDPATVGPRQEYTSIKDLEKARGNVSYQMTEQEMYEYHMKQKALTKAEEHRAAVQAAHDAKVEAHYRKINGRLTMGERR